MQVDGFTNVAAARSVSPALVERHINVASTVRHHNHPLPVILVGGGAAQRPGAALSRRGFEWLTN
jgi:hypothetical protein